MFSERPMVVVISGDQEVIVEGSRWFEQLLGQRFGLATQFIDCRSLNIRGLRRLLKRLLDEGGTRPLVIVYNGHGGVNGWAPWHAYSMRRITYQELAPIARRYAGPLLFINSSCFAMAMAEEFEKQGLPTDRIGVIAACASGWTSLGNLLLDQVASAWHAGKPYESGYMGEVYIRTDRKRRERTEWFQPGLPEWKQWYRSTFVRRWYGICSLVRPMEHNAFFSRRWGAVLDGLVIQHRRPEPSVDFSQAVAQEFVGVLETLQGMLLKFVPPR